MSCVVWYGVVCGVWCGGVVWCGVWWGVVWDGDASEVESRDVVELVFHGEDPENPESRYFEAESMRLVANRGASMGGGVANLYSHATIEQVDA